MLDNLIEAKKALKFYKYLKATKKYYFKFKDTIDLNIDILSNHILHVKKRGDLI